MLRFRWGLLSLDQVTATDTTFRAAGGDQYVSAMLAENQEVVVNPARLIAFSDSVRFRTHRDFNLAMLALHHVSSLVACGPGRLVLKCPGAPGVFRSASEASAVSMGNVMLYGQNVRFQIEASGGIQNYFFSGCNVRPISGDLFVTSPGMPTKVSFRHVIGNLIKQVYLPI